MKAMRRISRKTSRPKGQRSADAPETPSRATNKEEKRSGLLSPRNLRRVRSHSLARSSRRRQDAVAPKATQEDVEETQHHEEMLNNMPYETPNTVSHRKSTDWKIVTGELHRRMQEQETTPFDEQELQLQQRQQQQQQSHHQQYQQPHRIEISPMAQKILAKKERQRHGVKSSSESLVSGKTKGSSTRHTRPSGRSDRRSSSAHRGQRHGPPRLKERRGRGSAPTSSWADEASIGTASHQPPTNSEMEQTTIYASNIMANKETASRGGGSSYSNTNYNLHGKSSKKQPSRHPVDSSSGKRRNARQGRSIQVANTTPVLKPKRAPPTSPSSVSSRASSKAPSTKARPVMINASQKTMQVDMETIQLLLAERMAHIEDDEKWEGSTAAGTNHNNAATKKSSSSASYCVFSCTNPHAAAQEQVAVDPAEARELQHKMWLEYVKQSIHEAKHGDDAPPSSSKHHQQSRLLSPPIMRVVSPPDDVEPQTSEDSGVVEEYSEDYEDEDARSISSVDLLMKWIGNCGEPPDLSEHFPPTQREKLALHSAAKTPRGFSKSGRGR